MATSKRAAWRNTRFPAAHLVIVVSEVPAPSDHTAIEAGAVSRSSQTIATHVVVTGRSWALAEPIRRMGRENLSVNRGSSVPWTPVVIRYAEPTSGPPKNATVIAAVDRTVAATTIVRTVVKPIVMA